MKKFLAATMLLTVLSVQQVFCANVKETIILQPTDTALLFFDERPTNMSVSNPEVINAKTISNIFADDSKVTINATDLGISSLVIETKSKKYIYVVKVQKDAPKDKSMILDTPD